MFRMYLKLDFYRIEKRLHTIFWTRNATDFIDPILESSNKVQPRIAKIETLQRSV